MIIVNSSKCKGASHDKSGKPCQDYCWSSNLDNQQNVNGLPQIIIVSDGHGGDTYFRSDRGSRIAVEVAKEHLVNFCKSFSPKPVKLVRRGISEVHDITSVDFTEIDDDHESEFRKLFQDIVNDWIYRIESDWDNDMPTSEDFANAGNSVAAFFLDVENNRNLIKKAYGCTLIAAVRTEDFWFAFHLGDGKCVAINSDGECFEPIPWHSKCFQNLTTSLCQEGSESFRYCYGTEQVPALFIASDGIDDTYSNTASLFGFYQTVATMICENGDEKVKEYFEDNLYNISKRGSQDDMSIAYWCDIDKIKETGLIKKIYQSKIVGKKKEIDILNEDLRIISEKIIDIHSQIEENKSFVMNLREYMIEVWNKFTTKRYSLKQSHKGADSEFQAKKNEFEQFCKQKNYEIDSLKNELYRKLEKIEQEKQQMKITLGLDQLKKVVDEREKEIVVHEAEERNIKQQEVQNSQKISLKEQEILKREVTLKQYTEDKENIEQKIKDAEDLLSKYQQKLNSNV